jgi:hypothetical protein
LPIFRFFTQPLLRVQLLKEVLLLGHLLDLLLREAADSDLGEPEAALPDAGLVDLDKVNVLIFGNGECRRCYIQISNSTRAILIICAAALG